MRLLRRKTRKLEVCGKLELERVIGLTTTSPNGLACNTSTGDLAYLAGCVVVVYNVKANCQTRFLTASKTPKAFACVAYSNQGGKFLAAGESGHQPAVIVWEVSTGACVAEMRTHKYGVSSVQFSPNGKHLASLGEPHDGYLCLWDWKSGTLLIKTRASAAASLPACALQFASDGSFLVTGGSKHLKHWIISGPRPRAAGGSANMGMDGKSVKLGSQKESSFVAISCAPPLKESNAGAPDFQPLYALTARGILCLLHCGLAIEKWVDLKVRHGYALAVSDAHVGCACSDGIVRIFMHGSLTYSATLPRPAPYGYHGLTDANVGTTLAVGHHLQPGIKFPDAVACNFIHDGQKLAVIYGDHSLFVWDVRSFSKIGRYRTFLSHSSCIWDVTILPTTSTQLPQAAAAALQPTTNEEDSLCSRGDFATCSADGSIRIWNLGLCQEVTAPRSNTSPSPCAHPSNIYSKDILGVLYIDTRGEAKEQLSSGSVEDNPSVDMSHGFRSISVSQDGQHLAAGDRCGNLRIYSLSNLQLISFQEAHDAEILSLSFASLVRTNSSLVDEPTASVMPLLASGGRDRLIHIYDVNRDYDVIETLDDHSASITTVKFACNGSKLLSCSADKSVVFRNVTAMGAGCKSIRYHQETVPRGTIYDLDTDPSDKLAITVSQDKKLNILNLASGKPVRCFKPEGDIGEPIKVCVDPSGMYVVCSHSDRYMRVYDFATGELLAQASGHAEVITGVTFLPDCRRLISVSGDSCIFLWRLPLVLLRPLRKRSLTQAEVRPRPKGGLKSGIPRSHPKILSGAAKIGRCVNQFTAINPLEDNAQDAKDVHFSDVDENFSPCGQGRGSGGGIKDLLIEPEPAQKVFESPLLEPVKSEKVAADIPASFKFSVSRLPSWAQAKVALDDTASSDGKPDTKGESNSLQTFESRWAEVQRGVVISGKLPDLMLDSLLSAAVFRLGRDGYKLFSEPREELTPPATIRASGFGTRRRFSVEGGGGVSTPMDSTPESLSSQVGASPGSSPRSSLRKETHWKTVHTVFFNELDYLQEDSLSKTGFLMNITAEQGEEPEKKELKDLSGAQGPPPPPPPPPLPHSAPSSSSMESELASQQSSIQVEKRDQTGSEAEDDEDGVVVDLLIDDRDSASSHKSDGFQPKYTFSDEKEEEAMEYYEALGVAIACMPSKDGDEELFDDSAKHRQSLGGLESFHLETMDHLQTAPCSPLDMMTQAPVNTNDAGCKKPLLVESMKLSVDSESAGDEEEEEIEDDDFSPCRDLFSAHFDKLASDLKVEGSGRSSFSARFFARSNAISGTPVSSVHIASSPAAAAVEQRSVSKTHALLQDDDLDNNPGRLLAAERERLKLRERQDKMAVEVQRMRQRLVNLGIAVAEISHDGDNNAESRNCNLGDADEKALDLGPNISSPKTPDLVPSLSPRLMQERKEESSSLVGKVPPNSPISAATGVVVVSHDAQSSWCEKAISVLTERANSNAAVEMTTSRTAEDGSAALGTSTIPSCFHPSKNHNGCKADAWQPIIGSEYESENIHVIQSSASARGLKLQLGLQSGVKEQREKSGGERGLGFWADDISRKTATAGSMAKPIERGIMDMGEKSLAEPGPDYHKSTMNLPKDTTVSPAVSAERGIRDRGEKSIDDQGRVLHQSATLGLKLSISPSKPVAISATGRNGEKIMEEDNCVAFHKMGLATRTVLSPAKPVGRGVNGRGEKCMEECGVGCQIDSPNQRDALTPAKLSGCCVTDRGEKCLEDLQGGGGYQIGRLGPRVAMSAPAKPAGRSTCEPSSIQEIFLPKPTLPHPVEDYQKALQDLVEAADRASLLFCDVQSICQRAHGSPGTAPFGLPPDVLLLTHSYQRSLPGTLQVVQRLADEADSCTAAPSDFRKDSKFADTITVDDYTFGKSNDLGGSWMQSRLGTGASSTESLLNSIDVESLISRYSETLANQVLELVQKGLPTRES